MEPGLSFARSVWSGNMYLDLDVILAELKAEDWLASASIVLPATVTHYRQQ